MSLAEKRLLEGFRTMSPKARRHVLRFVGALRNGIEAEDVEFNLWFGQLVGRKGLARLTYRDILGTVKRVRRGG